MARPRKEIDKKNFESLCRLQCTELEIASFFECSHDTIERWCKREYKECFAYVYREKSAVGKISLRRYQFQLAEKNATMAIWLGKQHLGQTDVPATEVNEKTDDGFIDALSDTAADDWEGYEN